MNHFLKSVAIVCAIAACVSCKERNEFYYTDQNCPIESIIVTVQGEEVEGTVDGHYVSLYYEEADDFTDASIDLKLAEGYALKFPEDLSSVDLTSDAVLIFETPGGQMKKYFYNLGYAKSMIVDPSKIGIAGSDASVRVSDISGTMVVALDPKTMDQSNIQLSFGKGALVEGAKANTTNFNFTNGLTQPFYIYTKEARKKFTITLDVSSLLSDYRRFDLTDVTTLFVDPEDAEHIQVWKGKSVQGVPVRNIYVAGGDIKAKDTYVAETPFLEDYGLDYTDPMIYGAIGDWEDSRITENITGIDIGIVLMDADWYAAKVSVSSGRSIVVKDAGGFVSLTGMPATYKEMLMAKGKMKREEMLEKDSYKLDNNNYFRTGFAVTKDGDLSIGILARAKADGVWRMSTINGSSSKVSFDYIKKYSEEITDLEGLATFTPMCVRNGHKLNGREVLYASCEAWEPAFGQAWNGARMRAYVGRTYDNKIGVAVFNMGDNAERDDTDLRVQREAVIGTYQGAWLLNKLGWRDVLPVSTSYYIEEDFAPTIMVNGKKVSGNIDQKAAYALTFDKKQ